MCLFDCKGAYMKWKWTLPYIFSGAALMIGSGLTMAQNDRDAALIPTNTPDSVRAGHVQKFASRNFSADGLDAGAILIVPRYRGSRSKFHAVMYLGRGRLDDGKFIPDSAGRHIYVGHNRENLGDIFKAYDVSNVFAADTHKIARAEYAAELKRIESMPSDDLIEFISDKKTPAVILATCPHTILVRMARDRYFGCFNIDNYMPIITDTTPSVSMPRVEMAKNLAIDLKLNQKTM